MNGRGQYGRSYDHAWGGTNVWTPAYVGAVELPPAHPAAPPLAVVNPVPLVVHAPAPPPPTVVVQPTKEGVTFGSALTYGVIGALVLGGAFAASSLFTTVKKGKEPVRYYMNLYRDGHGRGH